VKTDTISDLEHFLKLQERLHGAGSAQVAAVMFGLGRAHSDRKEYKQANELLTQALAIQEKLGLGDDVVAETRHELEKLKAKQSETKNSDNDTVDCLTLSSDSLPVYDPLKVPNVEEPDEIEEAISTVQSDIDALRKHGRHTVQLADALLTLAKLYGRKKMLQDMQPLLLEAVRIREAELGSQHLSVSIDLKNLAKLYYYLGRYDESEQLFRRAMNIREAALGPMHSHVADIAKWYAKALHKCNRLSEAAAMEALVRESQAKDGTDWDNYRVSGAKAMDEQNYFVAQAMWLAALDEAKDFRFDDPRLCATLENLAEVYWKQAKYNRAESLCQRILQISESILGPSHPDVAQAANNMGLVCERQGKYAEASILYRQALSISETLHGVDHPDVVAIRDCHARTRRMIQKQIELKAEKVEGRWSKSGWWQAFEKS
jgi:tetratricopeptide (TPR) repeat protein